MDDFQAGLKITEFHVVTTVDIDKFGHTATGKRYDGMAISDCSI